MFWLSHVNLSFVIGSLGLYVRQERGHFLFCPITKKHYCEVFFLLRSLFTNFHLFEKQAEINRDLPFFAFLCKCLQESGTQFTSPSCTVVLESPAPSHGAPWQEAGPEVKELGLKPHRHSNWRFAPAQLQGYLADFSWLLRY